ncbi:MAG: TerC/Alx family metal homeostasis membrane protein [Thermoprotei archaeon]
MMETPPAHLNIVPPEWFWVVYHTIIIVLIIIDLKWAWGGKHKPTLKTTLMWLVVWISTALIFGAYIMLSYGHLAGLLYYAAYVIEYSLSIDNMFVFAVIFTYFAVPLEYQTKTLYIGILTAIVLRAIFIGVGITALMIWRPIIYVFSAILFYTGYKLMRSKEVSIEPERNPLVKLARKYLPIVNFYKEDKFIVRDNNALLFSPLILVLFTIESTDIMFAFDSVPAVIAVTENFFLAYASNIMAILGLRSLYFVIAIVAFRLKYLSKGLTVVLMFLGAKIIVNELGRAYGFEIPTIISIIIVLSIIFTSAIASVVSKKRAK